MIRKDFVNNVSKDECLFYEKWVKINPYFHMNEAANFIVSDKEKMSIELELEPNNAFDKNAIKAIGLVKKMFGTKRYFIGYVPAEIAAFIYKKGFQNKVNAAFLFINYDENFKELVSPSINIVVTLFVRK